jgi:hypothetical protein
MTIDEKNPFLATLLNEISTSIAETKGSGMARSDALAGGKCASCGSDATTFRDGASEREYSLTAWCQKCQDNFFGADSD